jgi:pyruvate ferredoxin oxidoreductase alpha subunit
MSKRIALEGHYAVSEAARMADVDVIAAYPITPQTQIVERLAEMVSNGELHAAYIPVESEHSAMTACSGAAAVGARVFTASCGQGFLLMHEVLHFVASCRQPVVMAVTNRAVGPPNGIWCDYSDAMTARDTGWVQMFALNNQEIFDLILSAFRIAEDPNVLLPVMVHLDGFTLSHVIEPVILPDQEDVNNFLPKNQYPLALHPDRPMTCVNVLMPDIYSEGKRAQDFVVRESRRGILQAWKEFGDIFGRNYSPIDCYKTEDAKTLLITAGSLSETAKLAIDKKRGKGEDIGLVILRLWRPFPFEDLRRAVNDAEVVIVLDRSISLGGPGGPICSEVKSALFEVKNNTKVVGFIGGLGGRNLSVEDFEYIFDRGREIAENGSKEVFETVGIRGC